MTSTIYVVLQRSIKHPDCIDVNGPFMSLQSAQKYEKDCYTPGYMTKIEPMITRNSIGKAPIESSWK